MSFTEAVRSVYAKFATFDGRAPRSEYWWFQLFNVLVVFGAYLILIALIVTARSSAAIVGVSVFVVGLVAFAIVSFIPSLAVTVRRLHDSDKSGWWLLVVFVPWVGGLILLIFMVLPSTPGVNRFGPPFGMSGDFVTAHYAGPYSDAWTRFTEDARQAAGAGYQPVSHEWRASGPGGILEVTYQRRPSDPPWPSRNGPVAGAPANPYGPLGAPPTTGSGQPD